jgi:RNA polymerase sigma factor for flagellar operon FliA
MDRLPTKGYKILLSMATLPSPPEDLTPEQLYLGHLKLIDEIAEHAARRRHFSREETEDFVSTIRLRLFENDYAIIRKFEGRCTFRTFLTVVINRQMLDYQNHVWGKWRPSAEAKRLGPAAVRLEVLTKREGLSLDEAFKVLQMNEHVEISREELEALAARLPDRNPSRRQEDEEELVNRPADVEPPDERVLTLEKLKRKQEVWEILHSALASLSEEDRLIATMRTEFQVAQIAKRLGLDQKPLYRRIEKIHKTLRAELEKRGIRSEDVAEILSIPERDFDVWR